MLHRVPGLVLSLLLSLGLAACSTDRDEKATKPESAPADGTRSYEATAARAQNPLKGFIPFEGDFPVFPHSMEFFYIPVSEAFKGPSTFDFSSLETHLNAIAGRHHQAVFRFYLDYPELPHGVPQFLIDQGVPMVSYTEFGGGQMPDYRSPILINALKTFVAAFGERYDGDPRIGFIFSGLLGHWGEWHTFPSEQYMSSEAQMLEILGAYNSAFTKTHIVTRYALSGLSEMNIGLHDDSFSWETLPREDWHFVKQIQDTGLTELWKKSPIGGELRPEIQLTIWDPVLPDNAEPYAECVAATHISWMLAHQLFEGEGITPARKAAAERGAASIGYDFVISTAAVQKNAKSWVLKLTLKNQGVAPFYSNWPLEIGVGDSSAVASVTTSSFDIRTVASGASVTAEISLPIADAGVRSLFVRIKNPLEGAAPVKFSNAEQDSQVEGWMSLGGF